MALLYADSFDSYATATLLASWTSLTAGSGGSSGITITSNGIRSTNGLRVTATAGADQHSGSLSLVPSMPSVTGDTIVVGMRIKFSAGSFAAMATGTDPDAPTAACLFAVRNASTTLCWIRVQQNGTLSLYRGSTLLGTTSAGSSEGVWSYFEFKIKLSDTVGTCAIKIDGVTVLSLTGLDSTAGVTTWDTFRIGAVKIALSDSVIFDIDDLILMDGSGSVCNNFIGDKRVDWRGPTADGANTGWTPSTGSDHFACVDETPANSDSDYVSTVSLNAIDTYITQDAPVLGETITAVMLRLFVKKEDSGSCEIAGVTRIGGTNYVGTSLAIPSSYAYKWQIWTVKPSDSTAWSTLDFNNAEMGMKKTL